MPTEQIDRIYAYKFYDTYKNSIRKQSHILSQAFLHSYIFYNIFS